MHACTEDNHNPPSACCRIEHDEAATATSVATPAPPMSSTPNSAVSGLTPHANEVGVISRRSLHKITWLPAFYHIIIIIIIIIIINT